MKNTTTNGMDVHSRGECSSNVQNRIAYLLIGGGIGATLALLFAPKKGTELRGDLADATRRGYSTVVDKAHHLNEKTGDVVHNVKEKADAIYSFASRKTDAAANSVNEKLEQIVPPTANKSTEDEIELRDSFAGKAHAG